MKVTWRSKRMMKSCISDPLSFSSCYKKGSFSGIYPVYRKVYGVYKDCVCCQSLILRLLGKIIIGNCYLLRLELRRKTMVFVYRTIRHIKTIRINIQGEVYVSK